MKGRLIRLAIILYCAFGVRMAGAAEYKYCALPGGGSVNYVGINPLSMFHVWYAVMSPIDIAPYAVRVVIVTIEGSHHEFIVFNNGAISFVNMVEEPADADLQTTCAKVVLPSAR